MLNPRNDFIEGDLQLNSDVLITPDNQTIKMKDISRINIILWEKRRKSSKYIFYPSKYELFLRDYKKIIINGNINSLNKIKINSKKTGYLYLYYFDTYKNGKWLNSKVPDFDALVAKPSVGCTVSIELIQ